MFHYMCNKLQLLEVDELDVKFVCSKPVTLAFGLTGHVFTPSVHGMGLVAPTKFEIEIRRRM